MNLLGYYVFEYSIKTSFNMTECEGYIQNIFENYNSILILGILYFQGVI